MEKLIRLMINNRPVQEQTRLAEEMMEFTEFMGVALACLTVVVAMAVV